MRMNTIFTKMRVALLMSFLCLAANVFAYADVRYPSGVLDKKISLSMSNKGLKNVLTKIEQAASVKFAYATQTIPLNNKVSIDVKDQRLGDVLEVLLSPYNVSYEAVGNQIIIQKDGVKMVIDAREVDAAAFKKSDRRR